VLEVGPPQDAELEVASGARELAEPPFLSRLFDPFLDRFARQAVAVGGRVVVARESGRAVGLLLTDPEERTASLFARSGAAAQVLWPEAVGLATYAEVDLPAPREEYAIYAGRPGAGPAHRFRHPVHLLTDRDVERVAELLGEVYGSSPRRWLGIAPAQGEVGFLAEVDGRLAGVAWVLVVGGHARLHGLTVRPEFRRIGIGADLLAARLLFAAREGVGEAISEIAAANLPSRAVAEQAGMRPVGTIHLYSPRPGPQAPAGELGAPRAPTSA
jgi:RimJ/RimL family protein N-acetyltransferase